MFYRISPEFAWKTETKKMILKKVPAEVALEWSRILETKADIEERIARNIVAEIETDHMIFSGDIDERTEQDVHTVLYEYNLVGKGNIKNKKTEEKIKEEMFTIFKQNLNKKR